MTSPSDPAGAPAPKSPGSPFDPTVRPAMLTDYLWSNRDRFTEAALASAAETAGYTPEEIAVAAATVARRRADDIAAKPVKTRARWVVLAAYGIVWLLFGAVYFLQPVTYNAGLFFQGVLTVALLISLAISRLWISGRRPDPGNAGRAMVVLLVVPVILLIGVAGLCLPFTRTV